MAAHRFAMPPHQSANQPLQMALTFAPQCVRHAAVQSGLAQSGLVRTAQMEPTKRIESMTQAEPEARMEPERQAVQEGSVPCRRDAPHDLRPRGIGLSAYPIAVSSAHVQAHAWLHHGAQCRCGFPVLGFRDPGLSLSGSPCVNRLVSDCHGVGHRESFLSSRHPLPYPLLYQGPYRARVLPRVQAGHAQASAHERHACWMTGEDCAPPGRVGASPPSDAATHVS